jgi:hypothetical protein
MSDEDLGKKFGGVRASGVTANKTYTIAESSDIRFSRFSHNHRVKQPKLSEESEMNSSVEWRWVASNGPVRFS